MVRMIERGDKVIFEEENEVGSKVLRSAVVLETDGFTYHVLSAMGKDFNIPACSIQHIVGNIEDMPYTAKCMWEKIYENWKKEKKEEEEKRMEMKPVKIGTYVRLINDIPAFHKYGVYRGVEGIVRTINYHPDTVYGNAFLIEFVDVRTRDGVMTTWCYAKDIEVLDTIDVNLAYELDKRWEVNSTYSANWLTDDEEEEENGVDVDRMKEEVKQMFEKGTYVRFISDYMGLKKGTIGVIRDIDKCDSLCPYKVQFIDKDKEIDDDVLSFIWCGPLDIEETEVDVYTAFRLYVAYTLKDDSDKKNDMDDKDTAAHYAGTVEPIELMQAQFSPDAFKGFLRGNIIKYAARMEKKGESLKDATKLVRYAEWLRNYMQTGNIYDDGSEEEED